MQVNDVEFSLLDYLGRKVGVEFLSDLRQNTPELRKKLARALRDVPQEAASPREWLDTYLYLTGKDHGESSSKAVRNDLIQALSL